MRRHLIRANDVDLCVETFGTPSDPALVLIAGAASSMDWWDERLCARLAEGGRFVIRYDVRDTGASTTYPARAPTYTMADLSDDVVGLLDALQVRTAHLAGISMGGAIAMRFAVEHASRLLTLTLISTSPGGPGGPANSDLPPMRAELEARFREPVEAPDWSDRTATVEYIVEGQRLFAGAVPMDEPRVRELAGRIYDRSRDIEAAMTNHWLLGAVDPLRPRLAEISAPTLVVHGSDDPLFPFGHAEALVREIPGATLLALDGVGHEVPPPRAWNVFVPALLHHTRTTRWNLRRDGHLVGDYASPRGRTFAPGDVLVVPPPLPHGSRWRVVAVEPAETDGFDGTLVLELADAA